MFGGRAPSVESIIDKYDGSLWIPSPISAFTGSDGTGAAIDGSAAGYVSDSVAIYGAERVRNGTFNADDGQWFIQSGTAIAGGGLAVNEAVPFRVIATQSNVVEIGKRYQLTFTITGYQSGSIGLNCGQSSGTMGTRRTASGTYTETLIAAGTLPSIVFQVGNSGFVGTIDNVSVREVILRPLVQDTAENKPVLQFIGGRWVLVFDADDKMTYQSPAGVQYVWLADGSRTDKAVAAGAGQVDMIGTGGNVAGACFATSAMTEGDLSVVKKAIGLM